MEDRGAKKKQEGRGSLAPKQDEVCVPCLERSLGL